MRSSPKHKGSLGKRNNKTTTKSPDKDKIKHTNKERAVRDLSPSVCRKIMWEPEFCNNMLIYALHYSHF